MSNNLNVRLRNLKGKTPKDIQRRIAVVVSVQEIAKSGWDGRAVRAADYLTLRNHVRQEMLGLLHTSAVNHSILAYFKSFHSLDMQINNLSIEELRNIFSRVRHAAELDERVYRAEYAKAAADVKL